ncbi:MAG: hypothetical protein RJQ00_07275 [Vicingaceae bacterium]
MPKKIEINFQNKNYALFQSLKNDEKIYALSIEEESKWYKNSNQKTYKVKALKVDVTIDQKSSEKQYKAELTQEKVEVDSDKIKLLSING